MWDGNGRRIKEGRSSLEVKELPMFDEFKFETMDLKDSDKDSIDTDALIGDDLIMGESTLLYGKEQLPLLKEAEKSKRIAL